MRTVCKSLTLLKNSKQLQIDDLNGNVPKSVSAEGLLRITSIILTGIASKWQAQYRCVQPLGEAKTKLIVFNLQSFPIPVSLQKDSTYAIRRY